MRVVIVGGGMAGLVLARGLRARGLEPLVLERAPEGSRVPGPIMVPFQAYDALEDIGVMERLRGMGRDVPPHRGGMPVSVVVGREEVLGLLREGLEVAWGHEVVDLVRRGPRVAGVRVRGPGGERDVEADLVVGADGTGSPIRRLSGIPAATRVSDTAFMSWRSPLVSDTAFAIDFLSDGRQVTLVGWSGGSVGSWQIERVPGGAEEALRPGLEAFKRAFARLLPAAAGPLEGVTEPSQLLYREVTEVRCDEWWVPGVALIGEALHAMNPEAGIGSGLGMGDAHALAIAVARADGDPDAACREYERWRRPAVDPYLAVGSQGTRVVRGGPTRDEERWPPPGA